MLQATIRVLLVEDNPGDQRLIYEMIRELREPFHLVMADTLKAALETLQSQSFELVLLDLSLPDSFGVETVTSIIANAQGLPIVVLTGFNDEESGLLAVQAGAQDYLIKGETNSYILGRALRYALERHRVEAALRRSQEEYRSLINDVFNTSTVSVLILNRALEVVWVNEATEDYFDLPREAMLNKDKRQLVKNTLKHIFENPDDYARRMINAYANMSFSDVFECHVLPNDTRQERWLEHWSQPIHSGMYAGGRIEYYTDITQRKRIEDSEREKSREVAALEERQRLARDLHDSVSQTLFTSSVVAESALRQWDLNPARARELLDQLHQLTHGALAEMRVLLLELRPASLTNIQLKVLIEQLIRSISSRRLLTTDVQVEEIPPLLPDVQIALYRITQEALNNVVKHADATYVSIRLWRENDVLHLVIEDDGRGFEPNSVDGSHLGLSIMQERAAAVGARLMVASQPQHGTRIYISWA